MQLRERGGLTVQQIAARMRLTVPRVQRLLEEEGQYRDLQQYVCNSVPAALLQDLIRRRQREDPALTKEEIAKRAGLFRPAGAARVEHRPVDDPRAQGRRERTVAFSCAAYKQDGPAGSGQRRA